MKSKEEETGTEREERGGRIEGEGEVNGFVRNMIFVRTCTCDIRKTVCTCCKFFTSTS